MDVDTDNVSDGILAYSLYAVLITVAAFLVRRWIKGGQFTERVSAKGRVAVVTGANSGIGFETVAQLNLKGAAVYLLCRDVNSGLEAKTKMVKKYGCDPSRLHVERCDLSDFSSVKEAAERIKKQNSSIDILVNNAGVMLLPRFTKTKDGHELTWQANHLGHYLLTELLLPLLNASSYPGRIVNVSSLLHKDYKKSIDYGKVDSESEFGLLKPYNRSKLANVLHAVALTNKLRASGSKVTANSCHPGVVATNLGRDSFLFYPGIRHVLQFGRYFFSKTPRDGAQTSLYLALSKRADGISGKYFADCKLAIGNPLMESQSEVDALEEYSTKTVKAFL